MSATPESERKPLSTSFSQEARPSGIDSVATRADITSNLQLGDLATVDEELFEVFDLEGRR
ncbi:hypothetical protein [Haloglomus litoreum]|uniref:hypothetical protein n=1 Tax=Haloglomus litoreum TaxID=3034026 RepID=UPI0023E80D83|nr:hypothetical protein [Haloglomus sp. DT116]